MRSYSLTGTTLPNPIPINTSSNPGRMFGTTSREEIYGRRPSESAKSPPAPLLAFRDFSKEAAERAQAGLSPTALSPTALSPIATMGASAARGSISGPSSAVPISPVADKTDRRAHVVGSRSELYGRRPSLVGPDGRVPPTGKSEWIKSGANAEGGAVFEDEEEEKAEEKKA